MVPRVFVYGTLKRGERNHHRMAAATFLGVAVTLDAAFRLDEFDSVSAPGRTVPSVSAGGCHRVAGEVYEVGEDLLDAFERVGVDYAREPVSLDDGELAFVYLRAAASTRPARSEPVFTTCVDDVAGWSELKRVSNVRITTSSKNRVGMIQLDQSL